MRALAWLALTVALFVAVLVSFDQGWKRGWDAHVESEMLEASRAYQLAPDTLKAWSAPDTIYCVPPKLAQKVAR